MARVQGANTEVIQDITGAEFVDSAVIDVTYDDSAGTISLTLTGLSALGTGNQVIGVNSGATGYEHKTVSAGVGMTVTHSANSIAIASDGTGWIADSNTWTYATADAPTFTLTVNADVTSKIGVGMRIKLTQTTAKYFIVTAISFGAGSTTITLYGGTDYVLANAAITLPFFSTQKAPFGFPTDPSKWTVTVTDTSNRAQSSPTQNTWYNLGSVSISIPIGLWRMLYQVTPSCAYSTGGVGMVGITAATTLSTANNSASDADFTILSESDGTVTAGTYLSVWSHVREKLLTIAAKTTYYLNTRTTVASMASVTNENNTSPLFVRAICAYL